MMNEKQSRICSRIVLQGKIKDWHTLESLLRVYPGARRIAKGSSSRYILSGAETSLFYIAEFSTDGILIEMHCKDLSRSCMKDTLVKLLGISSFVGAAYEFKIESIFPYLIETLVKLPKDSENIKGRNLPETELILSKRIIGLRREIEMLNSELKKFRS